MKREKTGVTHSLQLHGKIKPKAEGSQVGSWTKMWQPNSSHVLAAQSRSSSCCQELRANVCIDLSPSSPSSQGLGSPSLLDHKGDVALSHELAGRAALHVLKPNNTLCYVLHHTNFKTKPQPHWPPRGSRKGS